MKPPINGHLSVDEVDEFHDNRASARVTSHIETCSDCHALLVADSRLIASLVALPTWEPSVNFAERVMSQTAPRVSAAAPVVSGPTSRERSARRRVLIGGTAVAAVIAFAFGWAVMNPGPALGLVEPAWRDLTASLWVAVQALAANAAEQPWFQSVRDALATPARALPLLAAAAALYTVALFGMRRLLTRPAIDASW